MEELNDIWYNIHTYNELVKANINFINGKYDMSPYHAGPIENSELEDILVEMNINNLLTVQGQNGCIDDGICQRSFIEFFVPYSKKWLDIENKLKNDKRLDIVILDLNNGNQNINYYNVNERNVSYWYDENNIRKNYTNIPTKEMYNEMNIIDEYFFLTDNILDILKSEHFRYVVIAIKEFNQPGVENIVLNNI